MIPLLTQTKSDCCGCKACANACLRNAITFQPDEYGFEYPQINASKCVECGKCLKVCDFKKNKEEGIAMHQPLEGYAARHIAKDVYSNSTSGGMFTALSEWVVNRGGVIYGCIYADDLRPVHVEANSFGEVAKMRGSKYVQSDVGYIYQSIRKRLDEGSWVLFTGTPCQVAGLYSFLGRTETQRLLTADLICHGVPSPLVFKKYLIYLGNKYNKKIDRFLFRNKKNGWERPAIVVCFEDGCSKEWSSIKDLYCEAFEHSLLQRQSCFQCKYATSNRIGDFTIGDFWGWEKANIQMTTKEGVSSCLLNTEKAKEVFSQLRINTNKVPVKTIVQGNYHLRNHVKKSSDWDVVMSTIVNEGFAKYAVRFRKFHYKSMSKAYIKRIIKRFM